jgi:hypothetical protein
MDDEGEKLGGLLETYLHACVSRREHFTDRHGGPPAEWRAV